MPQLGLDPSRRRHGGRFRTGTKTFREKLYLQPRRVGCLVFALAANRPQPSFLSQLLGSLMALNSPWLAYVLA